MIYDEVVMKIYKIRHKKKNGQCSIVRTCSFKASNTGNTCFYNFHHALIGQNPLTSNVWSYSEPKNMPASEHANITNHKEVII